MSRWVEDMIQEMALRDANRKINGDSVADKKHAVERPARRMSDEHNTTEILPDTPRFKMILERREPARLVIIHSPLHSDLGKTIYLDKPLLRIGRSSENDLFIDDNSISRMHCQIQFTEGNAILHDLGSANGTLINGERLRGGSRVLQHEEKIRIGKTDLVFFESTEGDAPRLDQRA
jgi:hypothetical protein